MLRRVYQMNVWMYVGLQSSVVVHKTTQESETDNCEEKKQLPRGPDCPIGTGWRLHIPALSHSRVPISQCFPVQRRSRQDFHASLHVLTTDFGSCGRLSWLNSQLSSAR